MQFSPFEPERSPGFTLIELSIVLVIIGLIIGSVLVGQDLISSAAVRAQISQIEKYNTAVNTFRGKYGYLPGDIPNPYASQYGFQVRGTLPGQGDGDGIIQGGFWVGQYSNNGGIANYQGTEQGAGETGVFWVDLTVAGLIDGGFSKAKTSVNPTPNSGQMLTDVADFMPYAKIGAGNYVYVFSGGPMPNQLNGSNYFELVGLPQGIVEAGIEGIPMAQPSLSVQQAYNIDAKIDDGLPQTGRVNAVLALFGAGWVGYDNGPGDGTPSPPSTASCYDDGGTTGAIRKYSMEENNGAGLNCALSFLFQ